ncbi:uncharacterized protein MONBRDRAFT_36489 [Monosiga brevicollis MX1]|uniref:Uncharacterized protein n=1 Tax=Monosiga brevicollis TaxID=81824 RepID=A9UVJ3_MONBE|nr:uncharacterized protein MONBRDRAFT_36489 [Monosiga brevicollis MX1]EDQ90591.1 predicted protein [Monosiga brevicollis MX1]|eukprot:XP_001744642.1 hypothetical protein [Monosiga brevicollis MX1]
MSYSWDHGPSWRNNSSFVGSLIRETAEERDRRLKREREQREAQEAQARMAEAAALVQSEAAAPLPPSLAHDDAELAEMRAEADRIRRVVDEHERRAQTQWQHSYVTAQRADLEELQQLTARNDQELEEAMLALDRLQQREREEQRRARLQASQLALLEQSNNPLGLYAPHSAPVAASAPCEPSASAEAGKVPPGKMGLGEDGLPAYDRVHAAAELFKPHVDNSLAQDADPCLSQAAWPLPTETRRCASCFDPLVPVAGSNKTPQRVVPKGSTLYHERCYLLQAAPHCAHCGWTLISHPDRDLSGAWGTYKGKRYHVECYQYFAGPRCKSCFDVIFANPAKNISGHWITLPDGGFLHSECAGIPLAEAALAPPGYDGPKSDKSDKGPGGSSSFSLSRDLGDLPPAYDT